MSLASIAETVHVPAARATLGLTHESGLFGWDNEFGEERIDLPAFQIDRYMVTNGDYLRFIDAGGLWNRAFWDGADWDCKEEQRIAHPAFWISVDRDEKDARRVETSDDVR